MRNKYRWWGNQVIRGKVFRPNSERLVNPVLELNRLQARLDAVTPIVEHARGLCFGYDWNKGTAAKHHRAKLVQAVHAVDPLPDKHRWELEALEQK